MQNITNPKILRFNFTVAMNNFSEKVLNISSLFFENDIETELLATAIEKYKSILYRLSETDYVDSVNHLEIFRGNGKAVSTITAADCLEDLQRTYKFILGINNSIEALITQKKNYNIRILYAGTGPFAALLIPLILKYRGKGIHYSLMEINLNSLNILKKVLNNLNLVNEDLALICADASLYKFEGKSKFDIIISETMQSALAREQQVSVFLNLMSQSDMETIFIPERIEINLGLRKATKFNTQLSINNCKELDKVFEVSRSEFAEYLMEDTRLTWFPKKKFKLKRNQLNDFDLLLLMTKIHVSKGVTIDHFESRLTRPLIVDKIECETEEDLEIEFVYQIGKKPRFDYSKSNIKIK